MDKDNIPIDINIGKLQDWLISRRHVIKEWQTNILTVREKINCAIRDMPVHEGIASLLSGSYINYFHCVKIVEILKETEADSRNLFGRYGSKRMKDWQNIIKFYEKDNIYLAEAAQMLVRNINYEIPSLKKQISREKQLQMENDKKYLEYMNNEEANKSEFHQFCKQLGIKGDNIKKELLMRLEELPQMYETIGTSLKPLTLAVELYAAFNKYMTNNKITEVLPLLCFLMEHGNTTVYEWTYGEPPLSVDAETIFVTYEDDMSSNDQLQVCFGDDNNINFGQEFITDIERTVDLTSIPDGEGEIDWGNIDAAEDVHQDITDEIAKISLEESGIVVESDGVAGGVARGKEARTLLDNPATRSLFINQLVELESFLKMRLYEMSTNDNQSFSVIQDLPTESQATLTGMLDAVQIALTKITDINITHLHNIKYSPRYLDILATQLKQKNILCDKLTLLAQSALDKSKHAYEKEASLRVVLQRIIERTKELQANIESDISKRYKGRPVHIIGGVQFL